MTLSRLLISEMALSISSENRFLVSTSYSSTLWLQVVGVISFLKNKVITGWYNFFCLFNKEAVSVLFFGPRESVVSLGFFQSFGSVFSLIVRWEGSDCLAMGLSVVLEVVSFSSGVWTCSVRGGLAHLEGTDSPGGSLYRSLLIGGERCPVPACWSENPDRLSTPPYCGHVDVYMGCV